MALTLRRAISNILAVAKQSTSEEKYRGANWYQEANTFAVELATVYNVPLNAVAHAIAAISPQLSWETNKRAIVKLLDTRFRNEQAWHVIVLAGVPANVTKAKEIIKKAASGDPTWKTILSGQKVVAFANQIISPTSCGTVTIDCHAYSVAVGKRYVSASCPSISKNTHILIDRAYHEAAREYGNITASQIQAVTWTVWKRLHKDIPPRVRDKNGKLTNRVKRGKV